MKVIIPHSTLRTENRILYPYMQSVGYRIEVMKEQSKEYVTIMYHNSLSRYTSNGSQLYSVCDGGVVRRYRRYPDHHEYLGEVYQHKGDIQDLDISPYDECILYH